MATADKRNCSPPEHAWSYLKTMFEVFEMKNDETFTSSLDRTGMENENMTWFKH